MICAIESRLKVAAETEIAALEAAKVAEAMPTRYKVKRAEALAEAERLVNLADQIFANALQAEELLA